MACFAVPLLAGVASSVVWRKKKTPALWQLNLLFYGAGVFGLVDHWWNNELYIPVDAAVLQADLLLGCLITVAVLGFWGVLVAIARVSPEAGRAMGLKEQ
ncbi:TPA: hypothetical protein HA318_05440 [Candidatus Micrarchaeota archaeon]|nr:MAG: hypothetical protein AUJ65_02690 [Candidatus Micrarchaeota archaeon CG1_02_51_15]HII39415.1 hypothetical protein [Candidatus Micrarchaeota archaeon]